MPEFMTGKADEKAAVAAASEQQDNRTVTQARADENDKPFTLKRVITIMPIINRSLYRQVNDKVMPKKVEYIGSSVTSSQILSSNRGEVEAYFPMLLGISPNNENFVTRLKQYLNNIQVRVDALGVSFDASFNFNHKRDYNEFMNNMYKIEQQFTVANRSNTHELKKAIQQKYLAINNLESELYRVGSPVNLAEYILYRHCLLYADIAKDMSLIGGDNRVRMYFRDENREAELQAKRRAAINTAKRNYVTLIGDDDAFRAVYIQYCVLNNIAVVPALADDKLNQEAQLDRFSQSDPIKFNAICNDKDVKIKSDLELLISRGELIRSQFNQNITTAGGEFIAANMKEAIVWYKNPENEQVVAALKNKLKFF